MRKQKDVNLRRRCLLKNFNQGKATHNAANQSNFDALLNAIHSAANQAIVEGSSNVFTANQAVIEALSNVINSAAYLAILEAPSNVINSAANQAIIEAPSNVFHNQAIPEAPSNVINSCANQEITEAPSNAFQNQAIVEASSNVINSSTNQEIVEAPSYSAVNHAIVEAPSNVIHIAANQADVETRSNRLNDHDYCNTHYVGQKSATKNAKQKIKKEIPSKRSLEDENQISMPRKKKRRTFSLKRMCFEERRKKRKEECSIGNTLNLSLHTPKCNKPTSVLSPLPQITVSMSQQCEPPPQVSSMYVEAGRILDNAKRDIKFFFENNENDKGNCTKASNSAVLSADEEDLVFKVITKFQERHEYKKFYNKNLVTGQRLKDAIEFSNNYLSILRQAIELLPVYSNHNKKLINKYNKVLSFYKESPVHRQYRTICRNLVLVKMLIIKFNNKHGLPSNFGSPPKKEIAC